MKCSYLTFIFKFHMLCYHIVLKGTEINHQVTIGIKKTIMTTYCLQNVSLLLYGIQKFRKQKNEHVFIVGPPVWNYSEVLQIRPPWGLPKYGLRLSIAVIIARPDYIDIRCFVIENMWT